MLEGHEEKHKHAFHDFDGLIEIRSNPIPRYFAFLFYALVIWAILFIGYFLLSGWSSHGEFAQKMESHRQLAQSSQNPGSGGGAAAVALSPEKMREEGGRLYEQNCAACHGPEGEGGIGPDLTASTYKYGRDLQTVKASIADGRPGGMPGFGNQLSAGEVEALAAYITQELH